MLSSLCSVIVPSVKVHKISNSDGLTGGPLSQAFILFLINGIGRIGSGCLIGLIAHSKGRWNQDQQDGPQENQRTNLYTVDKVLQPVVHQEPYGRYGEGKGDQNKQQKLPGNHAEDPLHAGTEYLSDANLPGAPFGGIGGQPKQAQAGDNYDQNGKPGKDRPTVPVAAELFHKIILQEGVFKGFPGKNLFPFLSQ